MYRKYFKRFLDIVFSLFGFLLISPFFLILLIILAILFKGRPFFVQKRPGRDGKIIKVIKFTTMNDKRSKSGELLPDKYRLTKLGKLIRKLSLDEIPQLINVIRGDMSLVGPRPLLIEYMILYNDFQRKRHLVKPGITGLAQVSGRNAISWKRKFRLDVFYVEHLSLRLDLWILAKTIFKVFRRENVNMNANITMEKFTGNM